MYKRQEVREVTEDFMARKVKQPVADKKKILRTTVVIIGAGPAGLAVREEFNKYGVDNIVIDNNDKTGGQFTMQTHQFFFFEKEKRFGGMRGFDIARTLAGENTDGIYLNSTVWDLLEGKRAVSYTHLDVYKRQVQLCPDRGHDESEGDR